MIVHVRDLYVLIHLLGSLKVVCISTAPLPFYISTDYVRLSCVKHKISHCSLTNIMFDWLCYRI